MFTNKINENEYEIEVYDWVNDSEDYVCGHAKRQPEAEEGSDLRFWMFYPIGGNIPIMAGDLRRICEFVAYLNRCA